MSISSASHWALFGFSLLIASQQNGSTTDTLWNMFWLSSLSALSSAQRCLRHSMGNERKPWTHTTCMRTLCFTCVMSLLKNAPTTRWTKFRLRSAPSSNSPVNSLISNKNTGRKTERQWDRWNQNMPRTRCWKEQGQSRKRCRQTSSHHCRPARSKAATFKLNPFQPCATCIYSPKKHSKGTRARQKILESL